MLHARVGRVGFGPVVLSVLSVQMSIHHPKNPKPGAHTTHQPAQPATRHPANRIRPAQHQSESAPKIGRSSSYSHLRTPPPRSFHSGTARCATSVGGQVGFLYGSYLGVGWDGAYLTCPCPVCWSICPSSMSPDRPPGDDVVAVYCACNGKLGDSNSCCCCNPAAWDGRCSWVVCPPTHPRARSDSDIHPSIHPYIQSQPAQLGSWLELGFWRASNRRVDGGEEARFRAEGVISRHPRPKHCDQLVLLQQYLPSHAVIRSPVQMGV